MNHKGKRARWLYSLVYWPTLIASFGGAIAAVLAMWPPVPGQGSPKWLSLAIGASYVLASVAASRAARAMCKRHGIDQAGRSERVLEPVEPGVQMPDPAAVRHSTSSPRQKRAGAWCAFPIVFMFGSAAVLGWSQGDWLLAILGAVGAPAFAWMGRAAWAGRAHDDLEVDGRGLWDTWKARVVPWQSVRGGSVREEWDIGGELSRQQLRLEDERGRCVWAAEVKDLPPQAHEDLFGWLRARAGLKTGGA